MNRTNHDPVLRELGLRRLDALGWHGPTRLNLKLDPRDGQYKLLEISPKFWGHLGIIHGRGSQTSPSWPARWQ